MILDQTPTDSADDAVDRAARAMAAVGDADGWVEEIAQWEGREQWERDAHPDEYPASAYEDREVFRSQARVALDVAGPGDARGRRSWDVAQAVTEHLRARLDVPVANGDLTLTDFLLARISEDEEMAHEAIRLRDRVRPDYGPDTDFRAWDESTPAVLVGAERVLAECEAKRRMIVECASGAAHTEGIHQAHDHGDDGPGMAREALRLLALPYTGHPDYDGAWRL